MKDQDRDDEDAALVVRARAGDREAFGVLVTRHQRAALRTAYAIGGSESEAEDVSQEAFVKAFRSLRRFEDGRPLRPWLMQIVANEARNRRRSRGRRERLAGGRPRAPSASLPPTAIRGVGALLSVFRAEVNEAVIQKTLEPGTTYGRVAVGNHPAVWLAGSPHQFLYRTAEGDVAQQTLRPAGNTLIWTDGPFTYRRRPSGPSRTTP